MAVSTREISRRIGTTSACQSPTATEVTTKQMQFWSSCIFQHSPPILRVLSRNKFRHGFVHFCRFYCFIMPPPLGYLIKRSMRVWGLSVAYIWPKSRTESPRKTKIGTEVGHVTRESDTTFKVKRSKVNLQGAGAYCGGLPHRLLSHGRCCVWQLYCGSRSHCTPARSLVDRIFPITTLMTGA